MSNFRRNQAKYGDWRKLHLAVNALTGEVVACDLTSKSAREASRVPALVKQIARLYLWAAVDLRCRVD